MQSNNLHIWNQLQQLLELKNYQSKTIVNLNPIDICKVRSKRVGYFEAILPMHNEFGLLIVGPLKCKLPSTIKEEVRTFFFIYRKVRQVHRKWPIPFPFWWEVRKKNLTRLGLYTRSHTFRPHIVLFSARILFWLGTVRSQVPRGCRDSYVSVLIFHLFYLSPDCLTVIHSLRTPY